MLWHICERKINDKMLQRRGKNGTESEKNERKKIINFPTSFVLYFTPTTIQACEIFIVARHPSASLDSGLDFFSNKFTVT